MTIRTDDFNRADGGLGANWTSASTNALSITSNQVGASSGGVVNMSRWSADTFGAAQFSEIVLAGSMNEQGCGVNIEGTSGSHKGIVALVVSATQINLAKFSGGFFDGNAATYTGLSVSAGKKLRIYVDSGGTNFVVLLDNVALGTAVNIPGYTGGQPGIYASQTVSAGLLDDWRGGDGDGAAASIALLGACVL